MNLPLLPNAVINGFWTTISELQNGPAFNDLFRTPAHPFPFTRLLLHANHTQFMEVIIFIVLQENIPITDEKWDKYIRRLAIIDTITSIYSSQFPNPILQTERFSKHFEN